MMQIMETMSRWARPQRENLPSCDDLKNSTRKPASKVNGWAKIIAKRLPCYLLLGLPHSGKSTLLHSIAGQHWHKMADSRASDQNSDYDCWQTGQGIVVELNGNRLLNSDSQGLLFESLPSRSVDGVIFVVSADELLGTDTEGQRRMQLLHQHLLELQSRCSYRLPCYVLISKCDQLGGFGDFFSALSHDERQQPWGSMLEIADSPGSLPSQAVVLQNILQTMLPQRLQAERCAAIRREIALFPAQFARLQVEVQRFADVIFRRKAAQNLPLLRGVYFIGITSADGGNPCQYFVDRLFDEVIFADSLSSQLTSARPATNSRLRSCARAVAIGMIATLLTWSIAAFIAQKRDVAAAGALLQQNLDVLALPDGNTHSLARSDTAIALLNRARKLSHQHGSGWAALFGMHDSSVTNSINSAQSRVLEQNWLPALAMHLLRWMQSPDMNTEDRFIALKAWLMLVDPRHRDIDFLQRWINESGPFDVVERAAVSARLRQLHEANANFATPIADPRALQSIRRELSAIPLAERIYDQWKQRYQGKFLPLHSMLGAQVDNVFHIHDGTQWNVPLLYTVEVYQQLHIDEVMKQLESLERDRWVLGDAAPDTTQRLLIVQALKQQYLKDYAIAWNGVFNALSLRSPTTASSLVTFLQPLSDSTTSPLTALLRISAEQTRPLASAGQALGVSMDRIAALELHLTRLRDWFSAASQADNSLNDVQPAGNITPPQQLLSFSEQLPQPVAMWMATLARLASSSIKERVTSAIDSSWRAQVADFCRARIKNRYPFMPGAAQITNYSDFVAYFRPGGIEDSFVSAHLADDIDRVSWTSKSGAALRLPSHVLRSLHQAQKIRDAFFGNANSGFAFNVSPVRMSANMQRFTIEAGSSYFRYSHGPRLATQLRWPQDSGSLKIRFTSLAGSSVTRNYEGVWGLYRMLDAAQRTSGSDSRGISLTLSEGEQSIALTLAPTSSSGTGPSPAADIAIATENPLRRELLSDYQCAESLRW